MTSPTYFVRLRKAGPAIQQHSTAAATARGLDRHADDCEDSFVPLLKADHSSQSLDAVSVLSQLAHLSSL